MKFLFTLTFASSIAYALITQPSWGKYLGYFQVFLIVIFVITTALARLPGKGGNHASQS